MTADAQLLRQYVETHSEPAFAELVHRHLALVYHAALRQLGSDRHLAEDVAQSVFVLLAEKSPTLLNHPSLAGWLHTTTHFKLTHAVRAERRRQIRENAALVMSDLTNDSAGEDWEQIRPILDQVLLELNDRDREAVLLRYFENRPFAEIAAHLRLTESTAHKCVERALEKLRSRLAHRGVTSSAAALTALLGAQSAFAAPAGLAASVTAAVVASGLPAAMAAGGLTLMSMKTTVGVAALVVILAGSVATHEARTNRDAVAALTATERDADLLRAKLRAEEDRLARERAAAAAALAAQATAKPAAEPAGPPAPRPPSFMEERIVEGRAFLKAHPEMEAALVAYHKTTIRYRYADLIAAMGLTESEIDRFVTIVMNGSMRIVGQHMFRLTDEALPTGEYTRQLKELLGESRYQQFRTYEQTNPARGLADELTKSVYYTSTPLAPAQIAQFKQLVQAVLDDRSLAPRYTSVPSGMPLPIWNEVLKRSSAVLTPPQLDALNDLYQQAAFSRAQSAALEAYNKKK